jgi:DNA-binding protein HU-beta
MSQHAKQIINKKNLFSNTHDCGLKMKNTHMAKMTKSQLVTTLSEKTGLAKKDVNSVFDELTAIAYKEVKKVGEFVVPGFGKMVKAKRKARMGVNPATGAKIKIAAKTVVKFRLAKAAKEAVL